MAILLHEAFTTHENQFILQVRKSRLELPFTFRLSDYVLGKGLKNERNLLNIPTLVMPLTYLHSPWNSGLLLLRQEAEC